jgi:hypothetical protein
MSREPESPLDARHIDLLRDMRDADPPSPAVAARVRARLAVNVPGMHPRGGGDAGPGSAAAGSVVGKVTIAVAALLVGGAGGASLHALLRPLPPPRVIYVPQLVAPPAIHREPPAPSAGPAEPLPGPSSSVVRSPPSAAPSSSRTTRIAAERVLLDEARAALVQGDPGRALDRIEQHVRTFANPILGEERDAMEVEALVKTGRAAEARTKADAFRRRMPNSLFLPAVETAIESIP